jgi:hypothetical protein
VADTRTRIRRWGSDWNQLQAERALIEASLLGRDFDTALERMIAIDQVRDQFRRRTHPHEPPRWE